MKIFREIPGIRIKTPVVTVGMFDGLHLGHDKIISRLKEIAMQKGGHTFVFTFWPHPRLVLNNSNVSIKLLCTLNEKLALFRNKGIDFTVVLPFTPQFSRLSSLEFIRDYLVKKIYVDTLVVGFNHHFGHDREGNIDNLRMYARQFGFQVEKVEPFQLGDQHVSSTLIRQALEHGDIQQVNNMLGYNYVLHGSVVKGDKLGRKIEFPTANLKVDMYKALPKNGVYAVEVEYQNKRYPAMLNIGCRPTIDHAGGQFRIEVHIFNFNENLYGTELKIFFHTRIREEKKFENINSLKHQLEKDKKLVLDMINYPDS